MHLIFFVYQPPFYDIMRIMEQTLSYMDSEAWSLVLEIEHYVNNFIPKRWRWKDPIGTQMTLPRLTPYDLPLVLQGVYPRSPRNLVLIEALESYIEQKKENHCKDCRYFTFQPEEAPDGSVGRCSTIIMYVKSDFGCKLFKQTNGIRCGGCKRINGKLYFGE